MTIRKKWILTLAFIALLSILVNSSVLSVLTSQYFNQYLDETYQSRSEEIVSYLQKELSTTKEQSSLIQQRLDSYLGESIIQIQVYDTKNTLLAQAKEDGFADGQYNMSNRMGMMNRASQRGYEVVDVKQLSNQGKALGEVHVTRISSSANSYAAKKFQSSLFQNSLVSLGIVILIVFGLGWYLSKRISKDLKKTANMAHQIDLGIEEAYTYSNTTEIRTIQQSLVSLGSRLKLKQKARKTLVDEMVHQTRTPLTILRMHIEGMEDGVIEMQPEEMKVCENQIQNLSDIITNISSLIETGTDEKALSIETFELHQFLKQISNGMRAQFEKKEIQYEFLSTEKIQVTSDKYKIGQSIYNLLTNAYKFTPKHGTVQFSYQKDKTQIHIIIQDFGCGMTKEEQAHIFDAYYKRDTTTGNGGDGLGLFIAKQNMQSIGGNIRVESQKGIGSTFILDIPMVSNHNEK